MGILEMLKEVEGHLSFGNEEDEMLGFFSAVVTLAKTRATDVGYAKREFNYAAKLKEHYKEHFFRIRKTKYLTEANKNFIQKILDPGMEIARELSGQEKKREADEEKVIIINERAAMGNIVSAIKTFVPEKMHTVKADLQALYNKSSSIPQMKVLHPSMVAEALKEGIVVQVQIVLGKIKSENVLKIVLDQKKLIEQALEEVWTQQIDMAAKSLNLPQIDLRNYQSFVEPIMEVIVEKINDKKKKLAA